MLNNYKNNGEIVLIVEDTAANHEMIQTFLNDIDVKCESAYDGMEAVTMCSSVGSDYYSLILMDINLPCMDGFETSAKIRKLGITSPIIAITATSKTDKNIKSMKECFSFTLFKPFSYLDLYTAISPYIKSAFAYTLALENIFKENDSLDNVDPHICDVHQAVSNMGNNRRLFIKHFNNFKSNNVDLASRLESLVNRQQYQDAALLCHSIKGLSGMLSLTDLYSHIIRLETNLMGVSVLSPQQEKEVSNLLSSIGMDIRLICQIQF